MPRNNGQRPPKAGFGGVEIDSEVYPEYDLGYGSAYPGYPEHVYVHIPFCLKKCFYCDFNSYPTSFFGESFHDIVDLYVRALAKEAAMMCLWLGSKGPASWRISTVYVGGGTPSAVPADLLMSAVLECIPITEKTEVTVEVNPATVDIQSLHLLREKGVNRLSIGVQSFDDDILGVLGRAHTSQEAARTIDMAREVGFPAINIDLIYGCPGQTLEHFQSDLERCVARYPEHISAYMLSLSDEVPLKYMVDRGSVTLPDDDLVADMADFAHDFLGKAGYEHYEISNWALPGFRCQHNLNYWRRGNYLGLGAGAHSHIDGVRWWNVSDPREYIAKLDRGAFGVEGIERLTPEDRMSELMILGLRLLEDGVSARDFIRQAGVWPEEAFPGVFENLITRGLLEIKGRGQERRIRLAPAARNVANQVFMEFV